MSEENKDINITYETLYEILRREKYRNEIQKLPDDFFLDVTKFLEDKRKYLRKQGVDLINITEQSKVRQQYDNVVKIIIELYDRREKKINMLALNKARTNSLVDMSNLLPEENELLNSLVEGLLHFRNEVLYKVVRGNQPTVSTKKPIIEKKDQEKTDNTEQEDKEPTNPKIKKVKFKEPVPKFVGEELEIYGPFKENDVASLPQEIAELLLRKEKVMEMHE